MKNWLNLWWIILLTDVLSIVFLCYGLFDPHGGFFIFALLAILLLFIWLQVYSLKKYTKNRNLGGLLFCSLIPFRIFDVGIIYEFIQDLYYNMAGTTEDFPKLLDIPWVLPILILSITNCLIFIALAIDILINYKRKTKEKRLGEEW